MAIKRCNSCKAHWQDKTYGKGMRVVTPGKDKNNKDNTVWRCTVCGSEAK